jgi:hypothetical protein
MTTTSILKQTARALLANPPVYFLCTVYVTVVSLLIAAAAPELPGPLATQFIQAITAIFMAVATLPGIAIVTWYTACYRDGRPTTFRESLRPIRQNALSLLCIAALLGLATYLPGALRALPFPFLLNKILPAVAALLLLRFSIAFPIALLERQSPLASLTASWQRMRGHGWTALGIALCYLLLVGVFLMLVIPIIPYLAPWKYLMIGGLTFAILQVLWTVSFTCLYIHASPIAPYFADEANTYPPPLEDLPNDRTDMHHGEPHALAEFGDVAPPK